MRVFAVFIVTLFALTAQAQPPNTTAVAWMQTSAEYQANVMQTYKTATAKLPLLVRLNKTALLEQLQQKNSANLPKALLIDLDDTLISTSAYQGQLIKHRQSNTESRFTQWAATESAPLLPEALNLIKKATQLNVRVLLISNRICRDTPRDPCPAKTQTLAMLKKLGLNFPRNQMFFQNEYAEWGADQSSRREFIAQRYLVLMIVADDLNQMIPDMTSLPSESRLKQLQQYRSLIGEQWFILPNPVAGSWRTNLPDNLQSIIQGY
ncbi:HAD family acid phosphatase [Gayadomonas joobiniege]|uniref:HAD family acid phosphatase n=1 Tax=Gayadomonas joobiniege TaxID=1234606 RepID=UPI000372FD52|nr:HAD family acid phosphatase [Gayadomonas joobiniege]